MNGPSPKTDTFATGFARWVPPIAIFIFAIGFNPWAVSLAIFYGLGAYCTRVDKPNPRVVNLLLLAGMVALWLWGGINLTRSVATALPTTDPSLWGIPQEAVPPVLLILATPVVVMLIALALNRRGALAHPGHGAAN